MQNPSQEFSIAFMEAYIFSKVYFDWIVDVLTDESILKVLFKEVEYLDFRLNENLIYRSELPFLIEVAKHYGLSS
jgi:hypothetical protein